MSKIYPESLESSIEKDPKRRGEVALFNAFKFGNFFNTTKIYYSVSWLNKHRKKDLQRDGECDFIVTDEQFGVLFIEVKGGSVRKDENNNWWSGSNKIKNPIRQCNKSMYSIMDEFRARWKMKHGNDDYPRFFYDSFAFFPDVNNDKGGYLGAEYDERKFGFRKDLKNLEKKVISFFLQGKDDIDKHEELGSQAQTILHEIFTKPFNFERKISDEIEDNNLHIESLTKEQFEILEGQHSAWKSLWCEGPAGSGKTVIAVKKFLKEYNKRQNEKLIFLCKNKEISQKIKQRIITEIKDIDKNRIFIGTFDAFCSKLLREEGIVFDIDDKDRAYDQVFDITSSKQSEYDAIIIDESQDFDSIWWTIIENLRGHNSLLWVFGDANQRIWSTKKPDLQNITDEAVFLTHIMRNSKIIAKKSLCFYDGGGHNIKLDGPMSNKFEIKPTTNFIQAIKETCKKLCFEGVEQNEIVILASDKDIGAEFNEFKVTSIYAYKGMEADCVIFIIDDINKFNLEQLYVGITRAKTFLQILCKPEDEDKILKLLI